MTNATATPAPAVTSVRRTGPGAWLVIFTDGMRYPMSGGYRNEADVLDSAVHHRIEAQVRHPHHAGAFTVARLNLEVDGAWATIPGRYDCRDDAELAAQRLTRETGVAHESFFGEAEGYYEPPSYIEP